MNSKHLVVALCLVSLAAAVLTAVGHSQHSESLPQSAAIPEHVLYRQMFRHIHALNRRAAEEAQQGRASDSLRGVYRRQLGLNAQQNDILSNIAEECEQEVARLDEQAHQIISEFRARYPGGRVPQGETLPPPPAELQTLQAERNAAILRHRDRLQTALGEQDFSRVAEFVRSRVAANIRPVSPHAGR